METMRFVTPSRPIEPDVYKPLVVIEAEEEWERYKAENADFVRSYDGEFCMWCCTLIGKDYGSYSHSCEALRAQINYRRPLNAYESELRDWRLEVKRAEIGNQLLDRGMDFDRARDIVRCASDSRLDEIVAVIET